VATVRAPTERDDCKATPGFGDSAVVLPAVDFCDAFCGVCKVEESQAARRHRGALLHSHCGGSCDLFIPDRKVGGVSGHNMPDLRVSPAEECFRMKAACDVRESIFCREFGSPHTGICGP